MRAFNSRLPPQRAWQRQRHEKTYDLVRPFVNQRILNVGAGSGRLSLDLPGSISVDIVHAKLRYMRRYHVNPAVTASVFHLPFPDNTFDCVVCCEVVEHVPRDPSPIAELVRVLRRGGRLVLSTPDYGTPVWPIIEKLYAAAQPKGYADAHHALHRRILDRGDARLRLAMCRSEPGLPRNRCGRVRIALPVATRRPRRELGESSPRACKRLHITIIGPASRSRVVRVAVRPLASAGRRAR